MKEFIIHKAENEELTDDDIKKARQKFEEHEKGLRRHTLFYHSLYTGLIILIFSSILEFIDWLLTDLNISRPEIILTKLIFIGMSILLVYFVYMWFSYLEGQPQFFMTAKSVEEHGS